MMVHMIGQSIGAYTNATHGMTLSAVSMAYYRHICPYGLCKFKRFAESVWDVCSDGKTDEQIMNISDLGVTEDIIAYLPDGQSLSTYGINGAVMNLSLAICVSIPSVI